jgi:hypothetical protein
MTSIFVSNKPKMIRRCGGFEDLDDFEVWIAASGGVKALQGCLIVPNEFNLNSKFGMQGFVEEFGFTHYKARWLEGKGAKGRLCLSPQVSPRPGGLMALEVCW